MLTQIEKQKYTFLLNNIFIPLHRADPKLLLQIPTADAPLASHGGQTHEAQLEASSTLSSH